MQNHHCNRGGYSPVQRVLGYTPPLPETILSDQVRPAMIAEGPLDAVRRSEHLRDVAREAWAKLASRSRLLQSLRAKNRGPVKPLQNGQRVWVCREGINSSRPGSWQGPGTIVCLTPTGAFVSLRGQLWKVNSRNLRLQEEDQMADQMVSRYLANLRHDLNSEGLRSQRKFVDCTRDATAPDSRDQFPDPPQHDVQEPPREHQVEEQAEHQVEQQAEQQICVSSSSACGGTSWRNLWAEQCTSSLAQYHLEFLQRDGHEDSSDGSQCVVLFEPMKVDKFGRLHSVDSSLDCPVIEHRMGGIILLQVDDMMLTGNGIKFKGVLKSMQERF
eukprot:649653-Amphidinium_carterae.1